MRHPGAFLSRWVLCAVLVALFSAHSVASAADKILLRVGDSLPNGHPIQEYAAKAFMEQVTKATGGRVQFQYFPGEQLGKAKDMLMLTQTGVVDIGYVGPSYISDKMPLTAVIELPGDFRSDCDRTIAFWRMTRDGGVLAKHEFGPNRVRVLVVALLPSYQILLSSSRKVSSLDEVQGLTLRTSGGAMDLLLRDLKGVPVRLAPPQIYESMSRGTIDGTLFSYQSAQSYNIMGLLKSGTVDLDLGTVVVTYSIAESKWNQLPQEVRKVMSEVGESVTAAACHQFDVVEKQALEKALAGGMKTITFSPADRQRLARIVEGLRQEWAKDVDRRGKPGSLVLTEFLSTIHGSR